MNFYLDTSLVVAFLASEEHSIRAEDWMKNHERDTLIVSDWVTAEVAAALSAKVRSGALTISLGEKTMQAYVGLCQRSVITVPITRPDFQHAAVLAGEVETGLRGGDALHLAIASLQSATMWTLDKQFARACSVLDLPCELV